MGKIRVAAIGSQEEEKIREKKKIKREEKKKREESQKIRVSGMKGGQRVKQVKPSLEDEDKMIKLAQETPENLQTIDQDEKPRKKENTKTIRKKKARSQNYQKALTKIEHQKIYSLEEALPILREISMSKFDPTIEVHINTVEKGLRGMVQLPHGTGKKLRIEIADEQTIDRLVERVSSEKIEFDMLIATPRVMSKLARVAKILGPKGLMPNPKTGTISDDPKKTGEKFSSGETSWKTESDFPIIHFSLGKLSFSDDKILNNFKALIKSISEAKIKNITLKSTMSPGIKVKPA